MTRDEDLFKIARQVSEEVLGPAPFTVGDKVRHPDGRSVQIVGGQWWGEHGLSNFWYWRPVLEDGTLGETESGYGWDPAHPSV